MVYYLGRDVDVYITTEATGADNNAIGMTDAAMEQVSVVDDDHTAALLFAPSIVNQAAVSGGRVSDLTGCDLSITASDEDIGPFFGHIATQKVPSGRKETTVSLTRKKSDPIWEVIFNGPCLTADFEGSDATLAARMGARFGLASGSTDSSGDIGAGSTFPTQVVSDNSKIVYGYRVHVRLRTGDNDATYGQVFTVRNAAITGHSVSINPDGTAEETMEFTSSVAPVQETNLAGTAPFNIEQTAAGMF
tara:strand:- start:7066 stop:7809 length:744 start_codon:yes stop_codon:yes gene_type:complete